MKLRIEKAVYGGAGLARIPGGKTVFVAASLPGELVEATTAQDKRSFATGEVDAVLEASAERVVPACEYVPQCGGCQYQHANEAFQLQMKLDILKETLSRAHLPSPAELGSLSGPAWGYRNRVRLHRMQLGLGYRARASHKLLAVNHCPIAAPLLEEALAAVASIAEETALETLCEEVEFFTNGEQDQLLVSLLPGMGKRRPPESTLETFAELLHTKIPALTGVGLFFQNEIMHWGERSLTYTVGKHAYQVSLGAFFQVNRFLAPGLVDLALRDSSEKKRSGRLAWDLYSGVGLFARALDFEHVTAVESVGYSSDDLKHNLAGRPHRVIRSSTLDFLRRSAREKQPDLILVDPPRAGLDKEVCAILGKIAAPEMVYVSCDPATLARDLQSLLQFGYAIQTMHLVDLFPQTFHMETVTFLKRN